MGLSRQLLYWAGLDVSERDGVTRLTGWPLIAGTSLLTTIKAKTLHQQVIPLTELRTWDALAVNLPATPANDDLGLVTGTLGTHAPSIQSVGVKNAGPTVGYAGMLLALPYYAADLATLKIRVNAGMSVVAAGTGAAATVDVQAYRLAAPTVDICATAAQSINSVTAADKDFSLTLTNVVQGDLIQLRFAVSITDAQESTTALAVINSISLVAT